MKILTLDEAMWVIRNTMAEGSLRDTIELRLEEKATEPNGDLISRKDVYETFGELLGCWGRKALMEMPTIQPKKGNSNDASYQHTINELNKVVQEQAEEIRALKEPKKGKWIPVSERLPDPDEYVLCSVNKLYESDLEIIIAQFHDEVWWKNGRIKAWMPLPEPHKAESEE